MSTFITIFKLLPVITGLIQSVEPLFPAGSGKDKLELVLALTEVAYRADPSFTTPFERIAGPLVSMVGLLVAGMNKGGSLRKATDGGETVLPL
jgi:hypothetical protein